MKSILFPFSLVLALGLAGCGGGGGGGGTSTPIQMPLTVAPSGPVGGQSIALTVTATGATVKLCSATGTITKPLTLDSAGHFDEPGTITATGSSPIAADYSGTTDGKTLHITITTTGSGVISTTHSYDLAYNASATFPAGCS